MGVRYVRPDLRPTWIRIAKPGIEPAKRRLIGLMNLAVNERRKRMRGAGTTMPMPH
jgi:hypothetical protein